MEQLLLALTDPPPPSLDNFMAGQNQELLDALRRFASDSHPEHFLYLWGGAASGKSHLLQALAEGAGTHSGARSGVRSGSRYIAAASATPEQLTYSHDTQLYLIDNCEQLNPERQIDAFALFNQIRAEGGRMVCSGPVAPKILPVREDLRTRMGWGLIYQLHPLTDADKISAFQQIARERDWRLASNVLPYLITHYRRDMQSLCQVLDALDRYSLQTRRQMTLPLLRELLRTELLQTEPGAAEPSEPMNPETTNTEPDSPTPAGPPAAPTTGVTS
jgi:DnaA family protein